MGRMIERLGRRMGSENKRENESVWKNLQEAGQSEAREAATAAVQEAEWEQRGETGRRRRGRGKKDRLTGSLAAKICAFFLLAISFLAAMVGACACVYMGESGLYSERLDTLEDEFQQLGEFMIQVYEIRYLLIAATAGAVFLCLICFIFLMCSAGHHNGKKEIVPGVLTDIPLDVLTVLFLALGLAQLYVWMRIANELSYALGDVGEVGVMMSGITLLAVWGTVYCMDLALRVKLGKFWRNTLIFRVGRGLRRLLCLMGRGIAFFVKEIPMTGKTILIFTGVCILEFLGVTWFMWWRREMFICWALEKAILLPILLYAVLIFKKLLKASRALAEGRENYTVDTAWMVGEFKEYGENLNSLGQGISKAVTERMKSERLKTELISNVSHDLKTPLTSIINYADLLCEEINGSGISVDGAELDKEKAAEYAEVLLRQSRRLKKLLEDLLEASKATTGNLEVNLEPCEVGVLFSQTVGEYQQKMEQGGLELLIRRPEEPVKIMADGRRLWRVFDNLLNNICKYAQENTRVYLSLQAKDGQVQIIFRNISKYPLDISGEELEERFVRGDKSRHMEGNGLGLSIAKSLVELQNGRMEIVTDGDLFKVTLSFPQI